MKKILKWIGIIVLILIVIGALSGNKGGSTSKTGTTTSNKTNEAPKIAGLNETAQDGDLAFTVLSVDKSKTLGNSFTQKTAQGMFYVVTVKIENKGNKTTTFDASMAKIKDDQGREFERSIDGQTAKGLSQGQVDLFLQQIQPSLSVTGDLVFDLPDGLKNPVLTLKGSLFNQGVGVKLE
ncbi:hypothetical protein B6D29_03235 [Microgenomates bacterium UTCPR1]|nr:MAG: hypothetical protein B6D29_03235 [Microgenomates bacterium UTCPR1]